MEITKPEEKGYITFKEYTESQDRIKRELLRSQETIKNDLSKRLEKSEAEQDKLEDKVDVIDIKVDQVMALVLPLTVATQNTADNTKEMTRVLKEFTTSQTKTNGMFVEKFHGQDLKITGLEHVTLGLSSKKKYNVGVTVAAISFAGIFIGGLFQLAPLFFN